MLGLINTNSKTLRVTGLSIILLLGSVSIAKAGDGIVVSPATKSLVANKDYGSSEIWCAKPADPKKMLVRKDQFLVSLPEQQYQTARCM